MSSTTPKEFVDFEGLSYFWTRVQDVLQTTVDGHRPGTYQVLPGKQVESILQEKGVVKVTFGDFGGPDKGAARESLGVMSAEEVEAALSLKADRAEVETPGNLAVLDGDGDPVDSGLRPDDIKRVQEAWAESSPGSTYTVSGVSQDRNGNVTVEFAEMPVASYDGEGNYASGLMTGQDKEKLDSMASVEERVSFLENHMLQTKPEGNDPESRILKLFRGPLQFADGG